MAFKKGRPKTGGGSRKGVPNKINATLKDMILQALDEAGGVEYLKTQANENPGPFLALLGKVLPMSIANAEGQGPLVIRWED